MTPATKFFGSKGRRVTEKSQDVDEGSGGDVEGSGGNLQDPWGRGAGGVSQGPRGEGYNIRSVPLTLKLGCEGGCV